MVNYFIAGVFVIIPAIIIILSIITGLKRNAYQSLFKLLFTVLSIVVSVILTKTITEILLDSILSQHGNLIDANVMVYLNSTQSAKDIIGIIKTMILPAVFLITFVTVKFLFFLLNLIPRFILSDKAIIERHRTKQASTVPYTETIYSDTYVDEIQINSDTEHSPYKSKSSKLVSKVVSVTCCILSAVLILSSLALPINAYAKYSATVIYESEDILELDSSFEEVKNGIIAIYKHPTNQCYTFINGLTLRSFETFTNHRGTTVSASNALTSILSILKNITQWDPDSISAQKIYDLAGIIENDPFAKDFMTSFVTELCDAWARGEAFLGIEVPDLDNPIITAFLKELTSVDDITKVLRAAADILKIKDTLQFSQGNMTVESAKLFATQIFDSITPETVDIMKSMLTEEVLTQTLELPSSVSKHVGDLTGAVLDGIVEIKNDPNYSVNQAKEMLEKEAEALSLVVNMVSNPENVEPHKVVSAIVESSVISDTIHEITEGGNVSDPYQIGNEISSEFTDQFKENLEEHGVSKDNDMYKSILALIGK